MQFHWKRLLILISIAVLFLVLTTLYFEIRGFIGIRQNDKIISEITKIYRTKPEAFHHAINYFLSIKTRSKHFGFDYIKGKIQFVSFDSLNKEDFYTEDSRLLALYNDFDISSVRITDTCNHQKLVSFYFDVFHFYPRNRQIVLRCYQNSICDTTFLTRNTNPVGIKWQYALDSTITIDSYKIY